ncbi:GNAT family N-acetyltransferase [Dictyobacter kobayashii]|uniref:Putative N-acetyltransferase YfmK n=1 Tax=Dictyobacter kobayashii TaxID=2014872 RepID=A0A402AY14_9CHLR|nr:GNAT family N-acetyltransferase [Dictyobacter kobayashii]GCE23954.1 putative N-acetyltransferase YfmK [Dictyobacter kobayashii]
MFDLVFVTLDAEECSRYRDWFHDPELARRINYPDSDWFDYISTSPHVHTWMIYAEVGPVGVIQFEKNNRQASFSIAVNRRLRGQGYGKRIMRAFLTLPEVRAVSCVHAGVELDNLQSMRCLQAAGFTLQSTIPDEHGFLEFVYHFNRAQADADQAEAEQEQS